MVAAIIQIAAAGCSRGSSSSSSWSSKGLTKDGGAAPIALGLTGAAELQDASKNAWPLKHAPARPMPGRTDRLSVLTFNMEHRDRPQELSIMAERLAQDLSEAPDFILCQEVMFKRPRSRGAENTAGVLAQQLGYYCQGTKRTSDREGVAILSRYPFTYYAARHLEAQTSRLLLGFNRVSVMGEFNVPAVGRVRVVNVHFTNWGFESHVRKQQLQETLEWIARRERDVRADVTLLGGDFNMRSDSMDEIGILDDERFAGSLQYLSFNSGDPTKVDFGRANHRIDYIFIAAPSRSVRLINEFVLWENGICCSDGGRSFMISDHLPVFHEYSVSGGSAVAQAPAWNEAATGASRR